MNFNKSRFTIKTTITIKAYSQESKYEAIFLLYIFIICTFLSCKKDTSPKNNSDTQSQAKEWFTPILGTGIGEGVACAVDNNLNVISVGTFTDSLFLPIKTGPLKFRSFGTYDICIIKQDSAGGLIWAKQIGGTSQDRPYFVFTDFQNNIYVYVFIIGSADLDPNAGSYVVSTGTYLIKFSSTGNFLFAKNINGDSNYKDNSNVVDFSGNSYSVFKTLLNNKAGLQIIKRDALGVEKWIKFIEVDFNSNMYTPASIYVNQLGEVLLIGDFIGTIDFDPGSGVFNLTSLSNSTFLTKLDINGTFVWAKKIENSYGYSISSDKSNNTLIIGYTTNRTDVNPGSAINYVEGGSAFVAKFDQNGNYLWSQSILGASFSSLRLDQKANVYILGESERVRDLDPGTGNFSGSGTFILKLDQNGSFKGAKSWGVRTGFKFDVSPNENIYFCGWYNSGLIDLNPGTEVYNFNNFNGNQGIFTCKLVF
jgi:hypothetical protein